MAHQQPWMMINREEGLPSSNTEMVEELVRSGALRGDSPVRGAFEAVDRREFWSADNSEGAKLAYADMPLRSNGSKLHLSAPHIYAKAVESLLPLRPGMSFLNVGSGTGYFNSIISEMTGPLATNHGIEIWSETVEHAKACCGRLGKHHIQFTVANVYQLDVNWTMRYDRIYLGACANSRSKYLYRLLEVGGVLIGPFQTAHMQQLRRVIRQSETQFNVEVLGSVQFASLIEPSPTPRHSLPGSIGSGSRSAQVASAQASSVASAAAASIAASMVVAATASSPAPPFTPPPRRSSVSQHSPGTSSTFGSVVLSPPLGEEAGMAGDEPQALGLPGVPFEFSLWEQAWEPERYWIYPVSYRRTVAMALFSKPRSASLPCLPSEIWVNYIFPLCPKWWFETSAISTPGLAPHRAPPLPADFTMLTPACKAADSYEVRNDHSDDDGGSTSAPSSGVSSVNTTPENGPRQPPEAVSLGDLEVDMEPAAINDSGRLIEVLDNGHRHVIGAGPDPDDMYSTIRSQPGALEALLGERRRRERRQREEPVEPVDAESEVEADEEVEMADDSEDDDARMSDDVEDLDSNLDDVDMDVSGVDP